MILACLAAGCKFHFYIKFPPQHRLVLPPHAFTTKLDGERIGQSKWFIYVPDDYYAKDSGVFRKDARTWVKVGPVEHGDGDSVRRAVQGMYAGMPYSDAKGPLYDSGEIAYVGNSPAVFYYGFDSASDEEWVRAYMFGKKTYRVTEGRFPHKDARDRDSIVCSLFTIEYKVDDAYVPPDSIHFTLDFPGTGWLYDSNVKNLFFYTPSGHKHPMDNMHTDQIMILQFTPGDKISINPAQMKGVMDKFQEMKFRFGPYAIHKTKIEGADAMEVSCVGVYQGDSAVFYSLLTGTKTQPLLLAGWVFNDEQLKYMKADRVEALKKVAATLRVK